jgi:hypothetical protein
MLLYLAVEERQNHARFHAGFERPLEFSQAAGFIHVVVGIGKGHNLSFPLQVV